MQNEIEDDVGNTSVIIDETKKEYMENFCYLGYIKDAKRRICSPNENFDYLEFRPKDAEGY